MGRYLGDMEEDGTGERWREGVGGDDGGGHTGKGAGGMTMSMAFETQFCLIEMASEVMKALASTWVVSSSLMNW